MSKNKYTPYATKPIHSRHPTLGSPPQEHVPAKIPNYGSISFPQGMIGDYDGDLWDPNFLIVDPPKDLPKLGKNFEILEVKGVYYLVEHKVLSIRKWVLSTTITLKGIQNAFYDADQFFDPPE